MKENSSLLFRYIKMDLYRAIFSWRFLIGILGVVFVMFLAILESQQLESGILYIYALVVYGLPFMITMIFCAFSYASSFCEDWENKYFRLEVIRGKLGMYTCSKVIAVFLTAMLTMAIGVTLFVSILHIFLPWIIRQDPTYESYLVAGVLHGVLKSRNFLLFFFLSGIQQGILAGILALFASYLSLYISNKLLILSFPAIGYYFIENILGVILGENTINFNLLFDSAYSFWSNGLISYIFAIIIGIFSSVIFYILIYIRLKGRMQNE